MADSITVAKQRRLLEMLKYFDGFCAEHGITYYALGGTLLGAARHGGFIPWDDDVDVGLRRDEYDRLREAAACAPSGDYEFEFTDSPDSRFCYPYGKMYDRRTTLVENARPKCVRGIYLDIFPIDGLCGGREDISAAYRPVGHAKTMLDLKRIKLRRGRRLWSNLAIIAAGFIPPYIHAAKKRALKLDSICRKKEFDACAFVGNLTGAWGEREIVPREYFGTPVRLGFEDTEISCPSDYDGYLTAVYGDWRTPPPPEKQVAHHDNTVDFDTPYGTYKTDRTKRGTKK